MYSEAYSDLVRSAEVVEYLLSVMVEELMFTEELYFSEPDISASLSMRLSELAIDSCRFFPWRYSKYSKGSLNWSFFTKYSDIVSAYLSMSVVLTSATFLMSIGLRSFLGGSDEVDASYVTCFDDEMSCTVLLRELCADDERADLYEESSVLPSVVE